MQTHTANCPPYPQPRQRSAAQPDLPLDLLGAAEGHAQAARARLPKQPRLARGGQVQGRGGARSEGRPPSARPAKQPHAPSSSLPGAPPLFAPSRTPPPPPPAAVCAATCLRVGVCILHVGHRVKHGVRGRVQHRALRGARGGVGGRAGGCEPQQRRLMGGALAARGCLQHQLLRAHIAAAASHPASRTPPTHLTPTHPPISHPPTHLAPTHPPISHPPTHQQVPPLAGQDGGGRRADDGAAHALRRRVARQLAAIAAEGQEAEGEAQGAGGAGGPPQRQLHPPLLAVHQVLGGAEMGGVGGGTRARLLLAGWLAGWLAGCRGRACQAGQPAPSSANFRPCHARTRSGRPTPRARPPAGPACRCPAGRRPPGRRPARARPGAGLRGRCGGGRGAARRVRQAGRGASGRACGRGRGAEPTASSAARPPGAAGPAALQLKRTPGHPPAHRGTPLHAAPPLHPT